METNNHKGNHVFSDFNGFSGDEQILGEFVFNLMIKAITEKTDMKIVHKNLSILNDGTPPGFTSVLLLDASHITSHSYTDEGLLCLDFFSCGQTDTLSVMNYIKDELIKEFPKIKCTYLQNHKRFNF